MSDMAVFRDMATWLRGSGTFSQLKYVKGVWQLGYAKIQANGQHFGARVDFASTGWLKFEGKRIVDARLGFVSDGFVAPERATLGDTNEEEWEFTNFGRDPWSWRALVPMWHPLTNEQLVWAVSDTKGSRAALSVLLVAYADRVDHRPSDSKSAPIVELAPDSYPHPEPQLGEVKFPVLNILDWVIPPPMQRPALPKPVRALASLAPSEPGAKTIEEAKQAADAVPFDDEVPF